MSFTELRSLSRYDVRDPHNPMLHASHKVDSYKEGQKEDLERKTTKTIEVELPCVLDPNTVYIGSIGDGKEESGGEYDAGQDVTTPDDRAHGLTILVKDDIEEDDTMAQIIIMAHQPIKLDRKDNMW
jgi:hypothetical protein